MGSISSIVGMLPGMGAAKEALENANVDKTVLARQAAVISSMTLKERRNPDIIKASRKKRIAAGSGTTVQDVNKLLKQFDDMSLMMKKMKKLGQKGPDAPRDWRVDAQIDAKPAPVLGFEPAMTR